MILFCGCTGINYQKITNRALEVDAADGISKKEAILLAQNTMILNGLTSNYNLKPSRVEYQPQNNIWRIDFRLKRGRSTIQIWVSSSTGDSIIAGVGTY